MQRNYNLSHFVKEVPKATATGNMYRKFGRVVYTPRRYASVWW